MGRPDALQRALEPLYEGHLLPEQYQVLGEMTLRAAKDVRIQAKYDLNRYDTDVGAAVTWQRFGWGRYSLVDNGGVQFAFTALQETSAGVITDQFVFGDKVARTGLVRVLHDVYQEERTTASYRRKLHEAGMVRRDRSAPRISPLTQHARGVFEAAFLTIGRRQ